MIKICLLSIKSKLEILSGSPFFTRLSKPKNSKTLFSSMVASKFISSSNPPRCV
nr:MAG TPA: hypothetical protein [Caudoviricetes sp.]